MYIKCRSAYLLFYEREIPIPHEFEELVNNKNCE